MPGVQEISVEGPFCELLISQYAPAQGAAAGAGRGGGVLLCPPHPAYGGTRDDARLVMTAEALSQAGLTAWCVDYSGYHRGEREVAEVVSALEQLAPRVARLGLMGYSYGAVVASLASRQAGALIAALALLALPAGVDSLRSDVCAACPKLFVGGLSDTIATTESLDDLFARAPEPKQKFIVDDGHFFEINAAEVAAEMRRFFTAHLLPEEGRNDLR